LIRANYTLKPMNLSARDSILGLLLLLATVPLHMSAQEDIQDSSLRIMHEPGDWTLSISPLYAYHPEAHPRIAGELDAGLFLGKYVSVNANFTAGQGYIQMGLGYERALGC
jgi:hypothetical protein